MKRHVIVLALLLLGGATVNVAVAWGCAAWMPTGLDPRHDWISAYLAQVHVDPAPEYAVVEGRWAGIGIERTLYTRVPIGHEGISRPYRLRTQAGSPCLAMSGEQEDMRSDRIRRSVRWTRFSHALAIPRQNVASPHANGILALPTAPIWPGFAVNTIFYTAILWLLILGPFALRRVIRRRRGLCPACAYPIGDAAVCTECGRPLPGRSEVAA